MRAVNAILHSGRLATMSPQALWDALAYNHLTAADMGPRPFTIESHQFYLNDQNSCFKDHNELHCFGFHFAGPETFLFRQIQDVAMLPEAICILDAGKVRCVGKDGYFMQSSLAGLDDVLQMESDFGTLCVQSAAKGFLCVPEGGNGLVATAAVQGATDGMEGWVHLGPLDCAITAGLLACSDGTTLSRAADSLAAGTAGSRQFCFRDAGAWRCVSIDFRPDGISGKARAHYQEINLPREMRDFRYVKAGGYLCGISQDHLFSCFYRDGRPLKAFDRRQGIQAFGVGHDHICTFNGNGVDCWPEYKSPADLGEIHDFRKHLLVPGHLRFSPP